MSEAYAEQLLELTIDLGLKTGVGEKIDFRRVNIDTTVQEKAVTFPTDSKLLECAIQTLAQRAKSERLLGSKQSYRHVP